MLGKNFKSFFRKIIADGNTIRFFQIRKLFKNLLNLF